MRRFGKLLAFIAACGAALVLTVKHNGGGIRVGADSQLRAAVRTGAFKYDLSQLPIFSKTLFYVRENYFDKNRLDPKRMLVGALDFVQRDVPEILIDRWPEHEPKQVTVKVNGQQRQFSIERVEAPWSLRTTLQEIFRFVQPNLQPVPEKEEARRLVEIEMAATNGMLYTLDPHSVLLDVETYKDMRTQTQGKFGGLGIVIEMDKKNRITVKRPMPDTPAIRAGIKAKDHIVRINNESTTNMTLNEAVERLRGDVDTNVDVYVERDAQPGATKKFTITRASIRPPSIDPPARVLAVPAAPGQAPAKVGYLHMQHFSANSAGDLADALAMFEREHAKGIIMDLRGNPGGLYEQAQKVADAFIKTGTLVSMVGVSGAGTQAATASDSGHEPTVPLAVLVNQNSASASEIVAGAMKNLDRGVVIGEGTFGKGSVQVLYDIQSPVAFGDKSEDDKLGLKLTTAQYLTPGDVSIQGVGVIPDIETDPLLVQKDGERSWIRLQPSAHKRREADYEYHLEHASARHGEKPLETVSYLLVPKNEKKPHDDDDEGAADPDEDEEATDADPDQKTDFLMDFARDLLAQAKTSRRREIVASSKAFFDKIRVGEDKKVSQALEKLGVDWSAGPASTTSAAPQLALTLSLPGGETKVVAGTVAKIRGTVKNTGSAPAYRVRAILESDNPIFDENEMVFGKIGPGESKSYDLSVKVPASMYTRTDEIKATVNTQRGVVKVTGPEMLLPIEGKARPMFAYTYQTLDDQKGANHDGQVQRGEQVRLLVTVKNIGQGKAMHTEAILRNGMGQEGIMISAGRFEAKELAAGETKTFSFVYEVRPEFQGDEYQLELSVGDTILGESVTDKIKIKCASPGPAPEASSGTVTITRADAPFRETANESALVVGRAPKGAAFKVSGKLGAFTRVDLDSGRSAFVSTNDVKAGGAASTFGTLAPEWQVTPPVLTVAAPTIATGETVHLKGHVSDDHLVRDVYVRVYNRNAKIPVKKVFYQPNRLVGDRTKMDFEADIPLATGSNLVQVFARESNEVQSLQTVVVLKRAGAANVVAQPAPNGPAATASPPEKPKAK
jgi:carboxyl-terminal processing protease